MKPTPEDFKDKLAGKQCKHIACGVIKDIIAVQGLTCKVQRRKLAKGYKIYFVIENPDVWDFDENPNLDLSTIPVLRKKSIDHVRVFFPDAHLTSSSSSTWTIAEF